jgi:hypothetical protein
MMPYALFSKDAKLSKAYPTEADVWKQAQKCGLVVDAVSEDEAPAPRPVLDNDYEIRPCSPDGAAVRFVTVIWGYHTVVIPAKAGMRRHRTRLWERCRAAGPTKGCGYSPGVRRGDN